ncbi:MAG TPA: hypothetical protein VGN97_11045 [Mesorhizobium sp.]|jgi:hypothetical protein|nr:hypothetical protein [Mesorhizobium sp.]
MNVLSRIPGLLPIGALAMSATTGVLLTVALMGGVATPAQAQEFGAWNETAVAGGKQDRLQLNPDQTRTQDGRVIRVVLPSPFNI